MSHLVRSLTSKRLKKLDADLDRVARDPRDADAIHDLRVSIRRLRQELRVFQAWFDSGLVKKVRRRLGKLMERCAAVRNCDVAFDVLRAAGCRESKLLSGLEKERTSTREELARRLQVWRHRDRIRKWRRKFRVVAAPDGSAPGRTANETGLNMLPGMLDELFQAGVEAARPEASYRQMHQFRLKAKRMRYTLELFEKLFDGKTDQMMESLKSLQEKLGAINDCATTLEMVRADRAAAAAVRRLAAQRTSAFQTYWKTHFGPKDQERWKGVLGAEDRET